MGLTLVERWFSPLILTFASAGDAVADPMTCARTVPIAQLQGPSPRGTAGARTLLYRRPPGRPLHPENNSACPKHRAKHRERAKCKDPNPPYIDRFESSWLAAIEAAELAGRRWRASR